MTNNQRHDVTTIRLHWLTAAAVAAAWTLGTAMDWVPRGTGRDVVRDAHMAAGLLVGGIAALRLFWRPMSCSPTRTAAPPARLARLAVKAALYALPLGAAMLGVAMVWAKGRDVAPFGLILLPSPWVRDRALGHTLEDLHALAANGLLLLVALHAAADLVHGLLLRDGVLAGMLPKRLAETPSREEN